MPRLHDLQPSFSAGEITPRLAARLDFGKYPFALETCENLIVLSEGGAMRRSGTRYVAEVKSSAVKGRLKRFEFSTVQAYMLELADGALRFYRHQAQIAVADTDGAIANGQFTSGITDWDDRSIGLGSISHDATNERLTLTPGGVTASDIGWAEQDVTIGAGFTNVEHVIKFRVIGLPSDRIEFTIGTASMLADIVAVRREVGYHCIAFTPGVTTFYVQFRNLGNFRNKDVQIDDVSLIDNSGVEVDSPWAEADLPTVEGPQSADVLYLYHADHSTHKLQRLGHTTWSVVEVAWQDGPYLDENDTTTTLLPSAATGLGINLTLSAKEGVNGGQGWLSTDVGRLVRYKKTTNWGYAVIVSITSTTVAVADVRRDFEASPTATTTWRLGAWSGTTGYPQAATFFEQRQYVAATTDQPQTFWASQTADFENMQPDDGAGTVEADDALTFTLSADEVNAIRWLSSGENTLAIGTTGGEWVPSSSGEVITPLDITVRRQTTHGSAQVQPVRIGHTVLFSQRAKRKLREFGFSFDVDGYVAPDMTRLAEHITFGGMVEMSYAEERDSVIYIVRNDGQLLSLTFRRGEDVVGWGRHILGGAFSSGDAVVESVAVIPGDNGAGQIQDSTERDEVWIIVKRTINGATKRYVEFFERDFETGHDQEDAYYSDSIITYDGAAAATITGLDHLEGETVKVWGDGAVLSDETVASGQITLDESVSVAQIGLAYTHRLKTLKVSAGNPAGTPIGKIKRTYGLTFVLLNSMRLQYGPELDELKEKDFRVVSDPMDAGAPLFTGERLVEFEGDWGTDTRVIIEDDAPAPFTLLAIAPETDINPLK